MNQHQCDRVNGSFYRLILNRLWIDAWRRKRERTIYTYVKSAFINQNCNIYGETLGNWAGFKKYMRRRTTIYHLVRLFANKNRECTDQEKEIERSMRSTIYSFTNMFPKKNIHVPPFDTVVEHFRFIFKSFRIRQWGLREFKGSRTCTNFELWELSKLLGWRSTRASRNPSNRASLSNERNQNNSKRWISRWVDQSNEPEYLLCSLLELLSFEAWKSVSFFFCILYYTLVSVKVPSWSVQVHGIRVMMNELTVDK